MKQVTTIDGDTVGGLLYKYLGRDDDAVEVLFHDLNPFISRHGAIFESGINVVIPDLPAQPAAKVVRAWD